MVLILDELRTWCASMKENRNFVTGLDLIKCLNLSFDGEGVGGGVESTPNPPFLYMKTIEKLIRLCTVLIKTKLNYVKNAHIFKTTTQKIKIITVHNLITFSFVFTNKNGGGREIDSTPHHQKQGKFNELI